MKEKSILEQALLQVQNLEEAVKANAKGILASTMKQELNELLRESMEEEEVAEQAFPEEDENDMSDDITSDETDDTTLDNPLATDRTDDLEDEISTDDFGPEEGSEEDEVLDMTGASNDEVLKVFRAMKPEDGIVVKKDGNTIEVSTGDDDFIIKLDDGADDMSDATDLPVDDDLPVDTDTTDDEEVSTDDFSDDESDETDFEDTETSDDDTDDESDTEDTDDEEDETLSEDAKPYGAGKKKAGKNGPYTGAKKEMKEEDDSTEEVKEDAKPFTGKGKTTKTKAGKNGPFEKEVKESGEETVYEIELDGEDEDVKEGEQTESARTIKAGYHSGLKSKKRWKAGNKRDEINEEVENLKKQNSEYKKALVLFKEKLNEVAVFNANLTYATRLFTEHSTTKQEKMNIMKRFDSVSTLNEAKNLFSTIKTELDTKKPVTESVVEKITSTPSTSSSSEILSESKAYENPQFKRMKDLMNKLKN